MKHSVFTIIFSLMLWIMLALPQAAASAGIELEVRGLQLQEKRNVEAALTLPPSIATEGRIEVRWLERYLDKAPQLVEAALQPFGYYQSQIDIKTEEEGLGGYRVIAVIDPGPQVTVRRMEVRLEGPGGRHRSLQRTLAAFPLKQGAPLLHDLYEKGKRELRLAVSARGYLDATYVTHSIRIFTEENAAEVELVLQTGEQYFFGEITFVEKTGLFTEEFLRRFLSFSEGDVFSHLELHRSRTNFYQANRFDEVLMAPLVSQAVDRRVPIRVTLVPGAQQRLRPGVGYGTNTGARFTVSYQHMNVQKKAHAVISDLNLAQKKQFFETSYKVPLAGNMNDNFIWSVGFQNEDFNTYDSQMVYTEVERTFGLGTGRTGSIFVREFREDYEIGDEDSVTHLFMPGVRYYQRSYDNPLNPRRGYQYRLELRGGHDDVLSDTTLGQVLAAGSFILPVLPRVTLSSRVEAALTLRDDFADMPPSLRFFVGGDKSVRGYAYKSRGPRDDNNDVVGGDSLLVGSIECEYALNNDWGIALFYDVGSAYNAFHDIDFIHGAGLGIRRNTPIGPLKLDFANRISESHHGLRIHVSVGFDI
ncbi:MAG: autotransporter assembly complex protein TamA [Desulfuromonadales bacterium]|nr:autotransporter assembly complex protein TamA [Desulfuromonadales bacterium]